MVVWAAGDLAEGVEAADLAMGLAEELDLEGCFGLSAPLAPCFCERNLLGLGECFGERLTYLDFRRFDRDRLGFLSERSSD